ncbi:hypothetical protein NDU88_001796 [Pleurodeles waltl]|uniref:Uncharacterized protein n=1 Tax=Pleurodeles waltl TaxID=8319 RepID=A0AAV7KX55_PLEWA|nr:hypothetical protein NDU88_001796 [Pleurodeles waltl]
MLQPLLSNWASPGHASPHVEGDAFPLLTSPLSRPGVVLSPRPTAAHLCLWRRGRRSSPSSGLAPPVLHLGATAPLRRQRLPFVQRGSAGPRLTTGPAVEPRQVSPLSPAAIPPGFASPRDPRPIPDPGGGGPSTPPHRLTASGPGETRRSRRSSRRIGHVGWPHLPSTFFIPLKALAIT